jgi:hypothetical protein
MAGIAFPVLVSKGPPMRKIALAALALSLTGVLAGATSSDAATTTIDLATTGEVAPTIKSAEVGRELVFLFTTTNKSTTASADLGVEFTVKNGSVHSSDYICNLMTTHFAINPDTPDCETGFLAPGKGTRNAILVTATATGTMSVKACSLILNNYSDPVASNNCKTLTVQIV